MPNPSSVLLVGPFVGRRWLSIIRYVQRIQRYGPEFGVDVRHAQAPWWNPPSLLRGVARRWWWQDALRRQRQSPASLVHLADQALGHHSGRFARYPTVLTCHDLMPLTLPGYYRGRLERPVKRFFMAHALRGMTEAHHIITISRCVADDLVATLGYDPARISVVPNVLAPAFGPQVEPQRWLGAMGVPFPNGPVVVSVGHAGPYKNLELLLEAMAAPSLRGATLVRVGARLTPAQRERAASLGLLGRIVELGHQPSRVLARVYAASSVLAQPSRYEGFGVPIIEAMACGLPVVCSDRGSLLEVAGGAAAVVPLAPAPPDQVNQDDAAALARELGRVIEDRQAAADLRAKGLANVEQFRPAQVLPRLLDAYTRTIEDAHRLGVSASPESEDR